MKKRACFLLRSGLLITLAVGLGVAHINTSAFAGANDEVGNAIGNMIRKIA